MMYFEWCRLMLTDNVHQDLLIFSLVMIYVATHYTASLINNKNKKSKMLDIYHDKKKNDEKGM